MAVALVLGTRMCLQSVANSQADCAAGGRLARLRRLCSDIAKVFGLARNGRRVWILLWFGRRRAVEPISVQGLNTAWNAGGCCRFKVDNEGFGPSDDVDDVGFLREMVGQGGGRAPRQH